MSISVYVAGSSREIPRVRRAMDTLRAAGLRIALDWTAEWRPLDDMTASERLSASRRCTAAIEWADAFLFLAPAMRSDAIAELGVAYSARYHGAARPEIFAAGPLAARGIFAARGYEYERDEDAVAAIIAWTRE